MPIGSTVILAAGDCPRRGGRAWNLLANSKRIVACDSAAVTYHRRFHKWPDLIVGDLDSLPVRVRNSSEVRFRVVCDADQDTNDLTKAIHLCRTRGWMDLVVVGATGRREDHTLGNVFRALEAQVPVVTDHGVFHPVCGKASFEVEKGTAVSVFATDPATRMTSRGLQWPLDAVRFTNLYCATLNRATATRVSLTATHPAFVFIASDS